PSVERAYLTDAVALLRAYFAETGRPLPAVLQGPDDAAVADRLLRESALASAASAEVAVEGGALGMDDPAVQLYAAIRQDGADLQSAWAGLGAREADLAQQLGRARFAAFGNTDPPAAKFSLRFTDGVLRWYSFNGTFSAPLPPLYRRLRQHRPPGRHVLPPLLRRRRARVPLQRHLRRPLHHALRPLRPLLQLLRRRRRHRDHRHRVRLGAPRALARSGGRPRPLDARQLRLHLRHHRRQLRQPRRQRRPRARRAQLRPHRRGPRPRLRLPRRPRAQRDGGRARGPRSPRLGVRDGRPPRGAVGGGAAGVEEGRIVGTWERRNVEARPSYALTLLRAYSLRRRNCQPTLTKAWLASAARGQPSGRVHPSSASDSPVHVRLSNRRSL